MRPIVLFIAFVLSTTGVKASGIAIGLTDDVIAVDAGFSGATLTLFGAVSGVDNPAENVDIVSVIRGPEQDFNLRFFEKKGLIWTARNAAKITNAPGLYVSSSTRTVDDIAPERHQAEHSLRTDFIPVFTSNEHPETGGDADASLAAAFLTEAQELGLYRDNVGSINFIKDQLFTIKVALPANTPVGDYAVDVFLYDNGELLARDSATLAVNKVGVERQIYELAHNQPFAYGILCVALSLFAGWIASVAFRK